MKSKNIFFVVGIVVLLSAFFYSRSESTFPLNPYIDTVFAHNFSWEKYKQVQIGMNYEDVQKLLGKPLNVIQQTKYNPDERWEYSTDGKLLHLADFSWFYVQVFYNDGKVSGKQVSEFGD